MLRYYYHYNKKNNKMTVHYKGKCIIVQNISCACSSETKWNKTQPYLVMRGFCNEVVVKKDTAYIL